MKILIYGAGAVGLSLASFLIKAKKTVFILCRTPTLNALKTSGLLRTGLFGKFHVAPRKINAYSSPQQIPPHRFDYILICTKTYDSSSAAKTLQRCPSLWSNKTRVVLCQNGWGNTEIFSSYLPENLIDNARIITGFERPSLNHVNVTVHAQAIHFGNLLSPATTRLRPLAAALSKGGIPTEAVLDIGKDLWAKMLYNCALNPLGAICQVPYGALGKQKLSRNLMDNIFKEVFLVMQAAGHTTHWKDPEEYGKIFYSKFLPATATHLSSTLQDLQAGRRTEIDALNGIITGLGKKHGIPTPINQTLFSMVKFLENNKPRTAAI